MIQMISVQKCGLNIDDKESNHKINQKMTRTQINQDQTDVIQQKKYIYDINNIR